jgi:hypothetical protein
MLRTHFFFYLYLIAWTIIGFLDLFLKFIPIEYISMIFIGGYLIFGLLLLIFPLFADWMFEEVKFGKKL